MPRSRFTLRRALVWVAITAVALGAFRTWFLAVRKVHLVGRMKAYENIGRTRPLTQDEIKDVARLEAMKRGH